MTLPGERPCPASDLELVNCPAQSAQILSVSGLKAPNPFKNSPSAPVPDTMHLPSPHFPYVPTSIAADVLETLPFKTSNRILDDLRFTPTYLATTPHGSLLRLRPHDYRHVVAATLLKLPSTCLVIQNSVNYIPSVSRAAFGPVSATTVRGLIASASDTLHHFRVQILQQQTAAVAPSAPKHEYRVVPRDLVSAHDLQYLDDTVICGANLVDDAFFKSVNSAENHLLRVSVFAAEFSRADLTSLANPGAIKRQSRPSDDTTAKPEPSTPGHYYRTLLKVLKGPILLPAGEAVHTIDRAKTKLDAHIDTEFLFRELGFTTNDGGDTLVPPDLGTEPQRKEAYIRKAYELVYRGKQLPGPHVKDLEVQYLFSDTMSQVYAALGEPDKLASITTARSDQSNRSPYYVATLSYAFYPEELVIRCYENCVLLDPAHKLQYVDCLKSIISSRPHDTQKLQTYYNDQYLKGFMYSLLDYHRAIQALGIDGAPDELTLDDETVLQLYQAACRSDYKNYTYFNKQLRVISDIVGSETLARFLRDEMIIPQAALHELRIEEATEDEVVITAYEIRLDDVMLAFNFNSSSAEVVFFQKCLLSVATVRRSFLLMAYIDKTMPELSRAGKTPSYADALVQLSVDAETPDLDVVSAFESACNNDPAQNPAQFCNLRGALKVVAAERLSVLLTSFLRTGRVDPAYLPPQNWPTGLDNIGNTCYLNSLLQYYFCIRPLRDMVLQFHEKNSDFSRWPQRKIGGRAVEASELDRSFQFVYRLQHLYKEMIHTRQRCVQPSQELAYLSFLPLSYPVSFSSDVGDDAGNDAEIDTMDVDRENIEEDVGSVEKQGEEKLEGQERHEGQESKEQEGYKERRGKREGHEGAEDGDDRKIMRIDSAQIESAIEIGRQQDVTESIENVTFQLETALKPLSIEDDGEQYDLIKKLFCGKTKQTITPLDRCRPARSSTERFFSLIINVSDHPRDIYDALDNYFSDSIVHLDEGTVQMGLTILELPEILQFHVQRVLFDRERLVAYKSCEPIPFAETVYLDRYLDTEDAEIVAKRAEVTQRKAEIKRLTAERAALTQPVASASASASSSSPAPMSVLNALQVTSKYLTEVVQQSNELNVLQSTVDAVQAQVDAVQAKVLSLDTQIDLLQRQVLGQFDAFTKVGYTLFAIFIHRGEASHGHYWIYIRDMQRNIYRKYNDDTVTEVPESEVLDFSADNTATPYYVVYVKDELRGMYIEPLRREIREE